MNTCPLTFVFDYEHTNDQTRPMVMREFAANGCANLVLSDTLISMMLQRPSFEATLRRDVEEAGITFVDSHAPFGPGEDLDVVSEADRPLMLERLRMAMRLAARFGVRTMTIHTGNGRCAYPGYTPEQYRDAIIRSLRELLPLARELDMIICIENIWFETNTAECLLDVLAQVNDEHLGICYDAGHANLMARDRGFAESAPIQSFQGIGPVPYDDHILEKLLPHVVNCHLHDNNGQYDQHRLPGQGDVDWPHIMGLLKRAPRLACVQSEVLPVHVRAPIATLCTKFKELMAL